MKWCKSGAYDVEQFGEFVNKVNRLQVAIIADIVILKSVGMALNT